MLSTISPLLKIGLNMIGLWPDSSYRKYLWIFYMATVVIMQYFQYSYFFAHFGTIDFSELMDSLSLTLDYTLTFLKVLSLWYNRRIFSDILTAMNDDWNNCSTYSHVCMMTSKASLAHRCSNIMISLNGLTTTLYFIGSFINHRTFSMDRDIRDFPLQVLLPFDATNSPIFEFIVLGLCLHVMETAIVIALLNSLILTLVLHVSGQIDIMCEVLRKISSEKSHPSPIKLVIERHQRIISLSNNIDDFFSFVALIQFLWNSILICFLGIMIMISISTEGNSGLLQFCMPYVAITLEAFIFCFAGEYLSTKSKSISDAAYDALWYELSTSECRILLLIILRSQKRLTITAGKVMDLTLEGFTSLMKASASYMSVLHAIY